MMDKKLKAKWVKALRSGRYKQTQEKLHRPEERAYCCLGVLCRVSGISLADHDAAYRDLARLIGSDEMHLMFGVNDDPYRPPFEMIAGLIHEAL